MMAAERQFFNAGCAFRLLKIARPARLTSVVLRAKVYRFLQPLSC